MVNLSQSLHQRQLGTRPRIRTSPLAHRNRIEMQRIPRRRSRRACGAKLDEHNRARGPSGSASRFNSPAGMLRDVIGQHDIVAAKEIARIDRAGLQRAPRLPSRKHARAVDHHGGDQRKLNEAAPAANKTGRGTAGQQAREACSSAILLLRHQARENSTASTDRGDAGDRRGTPRGPAATRSLPR